MTVHVEKAGFLSPLGHNHQITAPIAGGTVDLDNLRVELHANATALKVRDRDISDKDRTEIQSTMLGPEVLDAGRYPEIVFRSVMVQPGGTDTWTVHGNLTLHGETHPVSVEVRGTDGRYTGTSRFRQTDFGIKPIKIAGGTIRVKDEVEVQFDIQLAH